MNNEFLDDYVREINDEVIRLFKKSIKESRARYRERCREILLYDVETTVFEYEEAVGFPLSEHMKERLVETIENL